MAQLWGGRFTKETDQLVYNFNASISFDKKFYRQDMEGSIAHVKMLGKQGILTEQETDELVKAVKDILREVEAGELEISHEYEDIHSFVEATLIDRLGDTGKKLHTGRSRNDQVALDMRLYTRQEVLATDELLEGILKVLLRIMEQNTDTFMPGFTHLQKAQPVTLAHHLGAYFEMFRRDRQRMQDIYQRMNFCPLGSGALAGTTYNLDRQYTADLLGFSGPALNSMDGVSDRDYLIEYLSALSTVMMHLSRFSEEVIIWNSNEYQFVEIDDAYRMEASAKHGFTNATDAADYLVNHGVPFRDAHGIVGQIVLYCIGRGIAIDDMSLEELQEISPVFEADIFEAVSMETCVEKRLTIGAPGQEAMKKVIALEKEFLARDWKAELPDWEKTLLE